MNLTQFDLNVIPGYRPWLEEQIRQLSIQALSANALTCNACGEIAGTYIIEYQGQTFRLPAAEAYALLQFVVGDSP